ncbi:MAG: hypothetical protein ACI4MU_08475 [Candidatus Ventricola sp.]
MKGTAWICLLLTLILALMGAQTLMLRQKTQALEATLTQTLEELTAMQTSMSSIARTSETINGLFSRLLEEGGPFSWLK